MIYGKSILAVIPARAGSKGLPNKNLKPLNGKKLIGWPIGAALKSGICDRVICSTDSAEIAELAKEFGAEIPFLRPKKLALDETPTSEVLIHAIEFFKSKDLSFDYILLLEPTSPLTTSEDILNAFEIIIKNGLVCDSLVSIAENVSGHPDFTFNIDINSHLISSINMSEWVHKRRQETQKCYFIDGTIDISTIESFLTKRTFIHNRTIGMEVPKWKSFEIDDPLDLKIVEMIMKDKSL